MRQQFQRTFDQIRMTPEQTARVRQALAEEAVGRGPRRRGRMLPAVALAAAVLLLMGAAAVWQSKLLRYFQAPGGGAATDLSQYSNQMGVSGTSENGWSLTVDECVGDDRWVFLWLTLTAPEGTQLPVPGEQEFFHLPICLSQVSRAIEEAGGGYGVRTQVYDLEPGDNQVQALFAFEPGVEPYGQVVSISAARLELWHGSTALQVWQGPFAVEHVALEYPDTVTHTPVKLTAPFCDTTAQAVDLKVTPFYFAVEFQLEEPLEQILDRAVHSRLGEDAVPDTVRYRAARAELLQEFEDDAAAEVQLRDGTAIRPAALRSCPDEDDPCRFRVEWEYRYSYNAQGELVGEVDGNQTFSVNPAQIETFVICGVPIPFAFSPTE